MNKPILNGSGTTIIYVASLWAFSQAQVGFKEGEIDFRFQDDSQCGSVFWTPP